MRGSGDATQVTQNSNQCSLDLRLAEVMCFVQLRQDLQNWVHEGVKRVVQVLGRREYQARQGLIKADAMLVVVGVAQEREVITSVIVHQEVDSFQLQQCFARSI